ncbi:MAG: 23S rRNA (adenine(2503)-C(2))-methyltransferase RlmN [Phycisphaerales bacterium]|nr:23S rRNA (adenine(2503)-C(2))-methyltransferase RlmN [Phycisphaerales bacterium]
MKNPANHIFAHTPETLGEWCRVRGMPAFRAGQVLEWVYAKRVADPAAMTNLSTRDREALAGEVTFLSGSVIRQEDATDGTRKLLIQWSDGSQHAPSAATNLPIVNSVLNPQPSSLPQTECVMIPAFGGTALQSGDAEGRAEGRRDTGLETGANKIRRTACISSQVGCPVGCRFCASGVGGLEGNLSAGRIVEQVWRLNAMLGGGERITNVVFMGMGEPLANFAAVTHAVRTLAAPWGLGISARKITISTVGLPAAIERLAEQLELPVTLALSLHAPNDDLRRSLIPWAEYTTIRELLAACQKWFDKTGREITLEYTLLRGVNDRPEHATELAQVARTIRANVNLIRYNEVAGMPFQRPQTEAVREFQRLLRACGVNAHIRRSRGRDIAAACGQLRHEAARL